MILDIAVIIQNKETMISPTFQNIPNSAIKINVYNANKDNNNSIIFKSTFYSFI